MKRFQAQVLLDLVDRLSGPIKRPTQQLQMLERQVKRTDTAMDRLATGGKFVAAGAVLAAPLILATREAIRFESAMADVKRVTDFQPKGFKSLSNDVLRLSLRIPLAATELAQLVEAAGQSKLYRTRQEMLRFAGDSGKMATAFKMQAADAGGAMTGWRTIFRLNQKEVVLLGDAFNYLGNNMDARASDIVNIANRTGATAKEFGLSGQQVGALSASFLALKAPPEVAATGINALLNKLKTAPQQTAKFQGGLAKLGLEATDLKRRIGTDAQGALLDFLQRVRGSGDVMGILTDLFGAEYSDDITKLVGSLDVYERALGLVGKQTRYAGSMNKEYRDQAATTQNALILLRNNFVALGTAIGGFYLPVIQFASRAMGAFIGPILRLINANPTLARTFAYLSAGVAALLVVVGSGIITLATFTLATAQARIGLFRLGVWTRNVTTAMRLYVTGGAATAAQTQMLTGRFATLNLTLAYTRARFAAATTAARAFWVSMLASVQLRIAALRALGFSGALQIVRVGLVNATRAAWAFTASLLTNPVFLLIAAVVALGASFVYAWRKSDEFRANVMRGLSPITRAWAGLKDDVAGLGRAFGPLGATFQSVMQRMGIDLSLVQRPLDTLAYGFGYFIGFVGTATAIVFGRMIATLTTGLGGVVQIVDGLVTAAHGLVTLDFGKMMEGLDKASGGLQQIMLSPLELAGIDSKQFRDDLNSAGGKARAWQRRIGTWLGVPALVPAPDTQPFAFGLNTAMWVAEGWGVATRAWVGERFQTARANTTNLLGSLTSASDDGKPVWQSLLDKVTAPFNLPRVNRKSFTVSLENATTAGSSLWQTVKEQFPAFALPALNRAKNFVSSLTSAEAAGTNRWAEIKKVFPAFNLPWLKHAKVKESLNKAGEVGGGIWEDTKKLFPTFNLPWIKHATFKGSLNKANTEGAPIWQGVVDFLKTKIALPGLDIAAIGSSLQGVLDTITNFGPQMLTAGQDLIGNLISGVQEKLTELTGIFDNFKLPNLIPGGNRGETPTDRATATARGVAPPIANRPSTPDPLRSLVGKGVSPNITFTPEQLVKISGVNPGSEYGKLLVQGLAQKVMTERQVANFAVDRMAADVEATFRRRLGIQSPSRVFMGLGSMVTQGLGQGIVGQKGLVTGAMRTLAAAALAVPVTAQLGVPALGDELAIPAPPAIGRAATEPSRGERARAEADSAAAGGKVYNFNGVRIEVDLSKFETKDEVRDGLTRLLEAFGPDEWKGGRP